MGRRGARLQAGSRFGIHEFCSIISNHYREHFLPSHHNEVSEKVCGEGFKDDLVPKKHILRTSTDVLILSCNSLLVFYMPNNLNCKV